MSRPQRKASTKRKPDWAQMADDEEDDVVMQQQEQEEMNDEEAADTAAAIAASTTASSSTPSSSRRSSRVPPRASATPTTTTTTPAATQRKKRRAIGAVSDDDDDEDDEHEEAVRVATTKSARLQATKRRSYKEVGSSDDEDLRMDVDEEGEEDDEESAAPTSRRGGRLAAAPKRKSTNTRDPAYLDLNNCLGRSHIERILARKKLPAPSSLFLTTFLKRMPKAYLARVHPQDLELFYPEAYLEYEEQRKAEELKELERQRIAALSLASPDGTINSAAASATATSTSTPAKSPASSPPPTASPPPPPASTAPPREEYYYLIKWKTRSYSPLSLHWIPHSLLMLFQDGAVKIRRYESTREYGETRGVTRISKSDEELEEDEEKTMEIAVGLRKQTLDEAKLKQKVEQQEATARAAHDALKPVKVSTLSSLLAKPAATDAKPESGADPAAVATSTSAESMTDTANVADPAAATATAASSVHLTTDQLNELEHQLELNRIARRLADISNDHKLSRFKKIRQGYFDPECSLAERIIGHRRRTNVHSSKTLLSHYFSNDTPKEHWKYYGLHTMKEVKATEQLFRTYLKQIDTETKQYLTDLAESLDPRIKTYRQEMERMKSSSSAPTPAKKEKSQVEKESKVDTDIEMKPEPAAAASTTPVIDSDEKKSYTKPESTGDTKMSDSNELTEEKTLEASPDEPATPSTGRTTRRRGGRVSRTDSQPSASPLSFASPPAPNASSGRSRRATKRTKYEDQDENIEQFLPSDEDEDLQSTIRASKTAADNTGSARGQRKRKSATKEEEQLPAEEAEVYDEDAGENTADEDDDDGEQFEFLVKWNKLPYDLSTWETRASLRRMDELRVQTDKLAALTLPAPANAFADLNTHIPVPSIASLPFQPISAVAFSNNLILKSLNLPIVIDDETHVAETAASLQREKQHHSNDASVTHQQTLTIHPTVPISSVVDQKPKPSSTGATPPQARIRTCMESLRYYLLQNTVRTRDSAIMYPTKSKYNPTGFTMSAAAVTLDMKFGPKRDMSLRFYQADGINWMALNWSRGRNSILADEMGLGKTVQSTLLMNYLATTHASTPILVVAPLSTINFWLREIERFTHLYGIIYRGSPESRKMIRDWDWSWNSNEQMNELEAMRKEEGISTLTDLHPAQVIPGSAALTRRQYKFNVLITSYEFIINDFAVLAKIPFSAVVIDEAQRLKNHESKLFEKLNALQIQRKLLLTGTPIQNNLTELFALLHFIEPETFHSPDAFLAEFGEMNTIEQVTKLYHALKPYVLRRLKSDVEKNLPPKEEILCEIPLTRTQVTYYRACYQRNYAFLVKKNHSEASGPKHMNSLLNISMQLRKVSQHPYLIDGCEQSELQALQQQLASNKSSSRTGLTQDVIMEKLVSCSGKFLLLDKLLPKLKSEGHRVLIFSQMTRVLDILQDYLHYRRYKHERLDGNVGAAERQASVDKFSAPNSDIFAFLLSTRAGGLGITLTSADTVIIFDSDWNLTCDHQAIDRTHRIGQTRKVMVYRLITKDTYEAEMFRRSCLKLTLDQIVMASMSQAVGSDSTANAMKKMAESKGKRGKTKLTALPEDPIAVDPAFDKSEVESMLRNGAYNIFGNSATQAENDLKSIQFAEEDISLILQRSQVVKYANDKDQTTDGSHVVTVEPNSESGSGGGSDPNPSAKSGSTFSKASFVLGDGEEYALSDPEFWSKLDMKDETPQEMHEATVIEGKRTRKAVQHLNVTGDDDDAPPPSNAVRYDVLGRQRKSGPARCQVCQLLTREDDSTPILVCDICEDEVHMSCLGLHAIPEDDRWACPSCVRDAKRPAKKRSAQDEDDDADYATSFVGGGAMGKNKQVVSIGAGASVNLRDLGVSRASTSVSALGLLPRRATSSNTSSATPSDPRAQYERLLSTYHVTHPKKTDAEYKAMTDRMWRNIFKTDPPPPNPPASTSTANSKPNGTSKVNNSNTAAATAAAVAARLKAKNERMNKAAPPTAKPSKSSNPTEYIQIDSNPSTPPNSQTPLPLHTGPSLYHPYTTNTGESKEATSFYHPQPHQHYMPNQYSNSYAVTAYATPPTQQLVYYSAAAAQQQQPTAAHPIYYNAPYQPYQPNTYAPAATYTAHYAPDGSVHYVASSPQQSPIHATTLAATQPHPSTRMPLKCASRTCNKIDATHEAFLVCGQCRQARYCSKECQVDAWRAGHKEQCIAAAVTQTTN